MSLDDQSTIFGIDYIYRQISYVCLHFGVKVNFRLLNQCNGFLGSQKSLNNYWQNLGDAKSNISEIEFKSILANADGMNDFFYIFNFNNKLKSSHPFVDLVANVTFSLKDIC